MGGVNVHGKTPYTPLTQEEQRFASEHHGLVFQYLRRRKLEPDEWYDVVIFRFLLDVKKWFARPDLHKWSFSTIACQGMRSAIGAELDKQKRRIRTISLEELVPGTEDVTWMDTITEENLKFVIYMEEDMQKTGMTCRKSAISITRSSRESLRTGPGKRKRKPRSQKIQNRKPH